MITFTDEAKTKIGEYVEQIDGCLGIRIVARRLGQHRFNYDITLVTENDTTDSDEITDLGSFSCYLDSDSSANLEGATVDWVSDLSGAGFKIDNPQAVISWDDPIAQKIQTGARREGRPVARRPRRLGRADRGRGRCRLSSSSAAAARVAAVTGDPQGGHRDRHPRRGPRDQTGPRRHRSRLRRESVLPRVAEDPATSRC